MKKLFLASCLVSLCTSLALADYVYPTAPFQPELAQQQLESGPCTLQGVTPTGVTYKETTVAIYPCLEHFQQFLDLKDRLNSQPDSSASIDLRAWRVRRVTQAKDGRFKFSQLKPGRYYVQSPAVYNPGDDPRIDAIFVGGGCVYFQRSVGKTVEVKGEGSSQVDLGSES